ncbi:ras-associating and dilute domain-containing protein-like [Genypterus blacodes]|uniref:ras-associating and dilute domain-containing protein-like n=1 Tax=Genypterus blacodes TaxID=154954 RepID=UPI003F75EB00
MNEMKFPPEEPSPSSSPRRRFIKLGRKRSDEDSHQSASSGSTCRSTEGEDATVRRPSKSRIRRHTNRLSGVFLRGPASGSGSATLTSGLRPTLSVRARKDRVIPAETMAADDPSELSNQITAPGILKIFGNEICEGAHYKSVLASTQSSATELIKEALERYGLGKEEAASFVLCDTIGSLGERQWRTEGFRVVGDDEKPLLLQSLWKPREGLARRFELRSRSLVEEKTSREKDTITAGINAQARKLQKSRSRVTSTLLQRPAGPDQNLWRSSSEVDLLDPTQQDPHQDEGHGNAAGRSAKSEEQNHIHLQVAPPPHTETLCPERERGERGADRSEREETESSDDSNTHTHTHTHIHPPHHCQYLLLLQGASLSQDLLIYLLEGSEVVMGRGGRGDGEEGGGARILLFAPDILPRHCALRRHGDCMTLRPCGDAAVSRNGDTLRQEAQLRPGDVIGLGQSYLFLFKDPLALTHQQEVTGLEVTAASWLLSRAICGPTANHSTSLQSPRSSRGPPSLRSPEGHSLSLSYRAEDQGHIIKEIVAKGMGPEDGPPLGVAFLLCVCVQHAAVSLRRSDLRRLLLLMATEVQSAVWEQTKELSALQPEVLDALASEPAAGLEVVMSGLRPLVVWMSNSLELLHFIQQELPLLLEWRSRKEQEDEEDEEDEEDDGSRQEEIGTLELCLSSLRSARDETSSVLEEVIMLSFQQCVFYITKVLFPILPGLLDCDPVQECQGPQVVEVMTRARLLLLSCQLHPEVTAQLIGFLFYFINASLFNRLMERGSESGFYQWTRGVLLRARLDLLLDWAHQAGLGDLGLEHTHTLASALNLLATPSKSLLQTGWGTLRAQYPALSPAQLQHLLSRYSPASPWRHTWAPSADDQMSAHRTGDIMVSFEALHPLLLPPGGHQLKLRGPVADPGLREELDRLKELLSSLPGSLSSEDALSTGDTQVPSIHGDNLLISHQGRSVAKRIKLDILPQATLSSSPAAPPSPSSSSSAQGPDDSSSSSSSSSCGAVLLSQKLRNLELQMSETAEDPHCLLTPPDTPHNRDQLDLLRDGQRNSWSCDEDGDDEGGFVSECLAALTSDGTCMKKILELEEEEEEDSKDEEVFSLELERGEGGLGLALVDTRGTSFRVKGLFIRAVVPDSPAGRSELLAPGDRILAVNGVSLLDLDYHSGKELIRSSGPRLRLLVARTDWMTKAIQTEC